MQQYIGAPHKDAAFLKAAQTQHFTEALGKHRSEHAQDKIFRHEQNVIHENGMPKPVHMHIKFPDDRKIRNADQVVRQKAGDSRNDCPPKGERILSSHHARRERRRNEPYNVPEGELQYIGKTASARKHRQPQKPHECDATDCCAPSDIRVVLYSHSNFSAIAKKSTRLFIFYYFTNPKWA